MTSAERAKESFREWCNRRGVWPPIAGTPTEEAFRRLGDALVEYVDHAISRAQNDKLEEAERAILNEHSMAEPDDLNIGLLRAARAVKALRLSTAKKD